MGPLEAPAPCPRVPPAHRAPSLCRLPPAGKLQKGAPLPARPQPRPHTLTETQEPPSCAVDALAAVSLGSTERQQPLAVTAVKRRQQPARAGGSGQAAPTPTAGLTRPRPPTARCPGCVRVARRHPQPPPPSALLPERLKLEEGCSPGREGQESFTHHRYASMPRRAHTGGAL